jgi:hypothetical protein
VPTKVAAPTASDRNANKLADPLERRLRRLAPSANAPVIVSLNVDASRGRVAGLAKTGRFAVGRQIQADMGQPVG